MKSNVVIVCWLTLFLIAACGVPKSEYEKLIAERDSLARMNNKLTQRVDELKKLNDELEFPSSDRLNQIKSLISEGKFSEATKEIAELKKLFPLSNESKLVGEQEQLIKKKIAEQEAEKARLKALGFKVFQDNLSVSIGNVSCVFSGFSFGRTFTFDHVSDISEYSYRTADKDNVYLSASLALSTKDNYASVPDLELYVLEDGRLKKTSYVEDEFASWATYGAKIGNYNETSHDFSKVNTVRYKIGVEISKEQSQKPLFLLIKKEGSPEDNLLVEDVNNDYKVIKIMNKNKI